MLTKLAKSLEHTEAEVARCTAEKKALEGEAEAVERAATKVWCVLGLWGAQPQA